MVNITVHYTNLSHLLVGIKHHFLSIISQEKFWKAPKICVVKRIVLPNFIFLERILYFQFNVRLVLENLVAY